MSGSDAIKDVINMVIDVTRDVCNNHGLTLKKCLSAISDVFMNNTKYSDFEDIAVAMRASISVLEEIRNRLYDKRKAVVERFGSNDERLKLIDSVYASIDNMVDTIRTYTHIVYENIMLRQLVDTYVIEDIKKRVENIEKISSMVFK